MSPTEIFKEVHVRHGKRLSKLLHAVIEADTDSQYEALQLLLNEEREKRVEDRVTLLEALQLTGVYGDDLSPRQKTLAYFALDLTDQTLVTMLDYQVKRLRQNREATLPNS